MVASFLIALSAVIGAVEDITTSFASSYDRLSNPSADFVIEGDLVQLGPVDLPADIVVKVLWFAQFDSFDENGDPVAELTYIQSPELSKVDPASGSLSYTLTLHDPPPRAAIDWPAGLFGVPAGIVFAFQDVGGDGSFSEGTDRLLALPPDLRGPGSSYQFVFYLPREPDEMMRDSPEGAISDEFLQLQRGYTVARIDQPFLEGPRLTGVESDGPVSIDLTITEAGLTLLDGVSLETLLTPSR